MTTIRLNELTLATAGIGLAARIFSSSELVEAGLREIADADGEGARAFTRVYAAGARAAAAAADLLRASDQPRGALAGLPISIKDLFDISGETTLAGSVALVGSPPATRPAAAIGRLIAAGAVIIGRTQMTEFAFSGLGINPHHGTPRNPWDRAAGRIPGGSSAGAAVSVGDGMAIAAIGTDTGGSVRIPAALCGLVGFKPTARRVPLAGVLPLSTTLDSIGPLARSVDCCALLDAVMAGEEPAALPPLELAGLRLLVPQTVVLDGLDATVAAAFGRALTRLSARGVRIVERSVPEIAELAALNAKGGFAAAEAYAWHRPLIERARERYDPRVLSRILRGADMGAADYLDLLAARTRWIEAMNQRCTGYDALALPTVPHCAPRLADLVTDEAYFGINALMLRNPSVINFLDGCALSLPCHAPGTAPVGFMLAGTSGMDRRLLALGAALEPVLRGN